MSVQAYLFIETTPGRSIKIAEALRGTAGVVSAHATTGPYDVIALVEAEDVNALGDFVLTKVHKAPGILRTLTNIALE